MPAPVAGSDDDDEVLRWIQERITCRIPDEDSNPELHQLVTKYQYHKCSKYCQRKKRVKGGTFITRCRFGIPRETCETATLFSVEECMKLAHRKMYKLPRSPEEIRINNYNPQCCVKPTLTCNISVNLHWPLLVMLLAT